MRRIIHESFNEDLEKYILAADKGYDMFYDALDSIADMKINDPELKEKAYNILKKCDAALNHRLDDFFSYASDKDYI